MIKPVLELSGGVAMTRPAGTQSSEPIEVARTLYRFGEVTVIDVDSAQGRGDNFDLVHSICREVDCVVGGGIRDAKRADALLRAGASRIIVGSSADEDFLRYFPRSKVEIGIDMKHGKVMRDGFQTTTDIDPVDLASRNQARCSGFVINVPGVGDVDRADVERFEALRAQFPRHTITSNLGATSAQDVRDLDRIGVDCQLRPSKQADIVDIYCELIDFEKGGGLVPVVVQDTTGQVLSLVYANKEAVKKSLADGLATYWSRGRAAIWTKGQTSGNTQQVVTTRVDCDRDALVFVVDPKGHACHLDRYSCFDDMDFSINRLEMVLASRFKKKRHGSYTALMLSNREAIMERVLEEARALSEADSREDVIFETADLLYFMLLNLVREEISLQEVVKELRGRAGRRRS